MQFLLKSYSLSCAIFAMLLMLYPVIAKSKQNDTVVGSFRGELSGDPIGFPGETFTVNFSFNGKGQGDQFGDATGIFRSRTVDWYTENTKGANSGEVLCLSSEQNEDGSLQAGLFTRLTVVTPNIFGFENGDININQFFDSNSGSGIGDEARFINISQLARIGIIPPNLIPVIINGGCSYDAIQQWFDVIDPGSVLFPFLVSTGQKNLKITDGYNP